LRRVLCGRTGRRKELACRHQRCRCCSKAKGRAGRVKVRHLEGELEGLEELVSAAHLRCRWKDWAKVEKDEQREQRLIEHLAAREPLEDVVLDAAEEVLEAAHEGVVIEHHPRGYTSWNEERDPGFGWWGFWAG
jgi:hypothetical protein